MSTTEEVLEVSTFFEDATRKTEQGDTSTKKARLVEGEYLGHIVNARSIVRPVRNTYQARIYNYDVVVATENQGMKYQYEDIAGKHVDITGGQFVDRKLIAKGVFQFLDPKEGDDFQGNPTDNWRYSAFCDALGITPKEETRTIDGKETTVKLLPTLTDDDMNGKPVKAVLKKVDDEWTNNKGETMNYSWRVLFVRKWEQGHTKKMEVNMDDLPF